MLSTIAPDVNTRTYSFARGFNTGLLTAGARLLLHTTPVVGDVASLAIVNLSERSRDPLVMDTVQLVHTGHGYAIKLPLLIR